MPCSGVPDDRASVLQYAKDKLFELVCKEATPEQWVQWLRVPLELAASRGVVELVNTLVAAGADDVCDSLHLAVRGGHEEVVRALLDRGASATLADEDGDAPIHIAARLGHEDIVSLLLVRWADVNILDNTGSSPLHLAARAGHHSAAKALLTAGADLSRRKHGWSALDFAAREGHVEVIRELVQHGADVMSRDPNGMTALHIAARNNHAAAVNILIGAGADVDVGDDIAWAPLHRAAHSGSCDAMFALLRHQAGVNSQGVMGWQPLHLACRKLHLGAADLLLRWGADETVVDIEDQCAMDMIGRGREEDEQHARAEDMERMRKLLARAPADRAWRRRGLLVLCRAFPDKISLGLASSQDAGDSVEQMDGERGRSRANKRGKTREGAADYDKGDAEGGERGRAIIKGTSGSVYSVGDRVVGLEQDGLFRLIVSFL